MNSKMRLFWLVLFVGGNLLGGVRPEDHNLFGDELNQQEDDAQEGVLRTIVAQQEPEERLRLAYSLRSRPGATRQDHEVAYEIFYDISHDERAVMHWQEAANEGAICLLQGLGVEQDYQAARAWFESVAFEDDHVHPVSVQVPRARLYLGQIYQQGLGVEVNEERAKALCLSVYESGTARKDVKAQAARMLGEIDQKAENYSQALSCFEYVVNPNNQASVADRVLASLALSKMYLYGLGVTHDFGEVERHACYVANMSSLIPALRFQAKLFLGIIYLRENNDVEQDIETGEKFLWEIVNTTSELFYGDKVCAALELVDLYRNNPNKKSAKNDGVARILLEHLSQLESEFIKADQKAEACYLLASYYLYGMGGVEVDKEKALELLRSVMAMTDAPDYIKSRVYYGLGVVYLKQDTITSRYSAKKIFEDILEREDDTCLSEAERLMMLASLGELYYASRADRDLAKAQKLFSEVVNSGKLDTLSIKPAIKELIYECLQKKVEKETARAGEQRACFTVRGGVKKRARR